MALRSARAWHGQAAMSLRQAIVLNGTVHLLNAKVIMTPVKIHLAVTGNASRNCHVRAPFKRVGAALARNKISTIGLLAHVHHLTKLGAGCLYNFFHAHWLS